MGSFQDLPSADYWILEAGYFQSTLPMNRCGQVVWAKLPLRNPPVMRHWPAVRTTATPKILWRRRSRGPFGQHVLQAFKLSRARFLQAIQSLGWIIGQFGTDSVGVLSGLKARLQSSDTVVCGSRTNDTACKNEQCCR